MPKFCSPRSTPASRGPSASSGSPANTRSTASTTEGRRCTARSRRNANEPGLDHIDDALDRPLARRLDDQRHLFRLRDIDADPHAFVAPAPLGLAEIDRLAVEQYAD